MTTTFTDKKGRTWDTDLDILICRRIDASDFTEYYPHKWSIFSLDQNVLKNIIAKPTLTFAIIWAVIQPQVKLKYQKYKLWQDRKISRDPASNTRTEEEPPPADTFPIDPETNLAEAELEFVSAINSKARMEGHQAFLEALGDFFPELKTALSASRHQIAALSKKIEEKVQETEPLVLQMMEEDMDQAVEQIRSRLKKTREERVGEILSPLHLSPVGASPS